MFCAWVVCSLLLRSCLEAQLLSSVPANGLEKSCPCSREVGRHRSGIMCPASSKYSQHSWAQEGLNVSRTSPFEGVLVGRARSGGEGSTRGAHISGVAYWGALILMPSFRRLQKSSSICTPGYGDPPAGDSEGSTGLVMAEGAEDHGAGGGVGGTRVHVCRLPLN